MAKDTDTADVKKPEQTDEVAFVGAAPVTDAPEKKKDLAADQPGFQEHPTVAAEAEAAKAKKAKNGEDFELFEQNNPPPQEEAAEKKPKKPKPEEQPVYVPQDTYVPGISSQNMILLNDAWGIATITRALDEALENARISHDESSGKMKFKLANGHKIEWFPEHNGIKGFIGFPHRTKMDDLDAKMVIAVLASQGKEKISLYGNRESKEKMWLEAMRQGLQVTNFQPLPSDDPNSVYQKWLRESRDLHTGAAANPDAPKKENTVDQPENKADKPEETKPVDNSKPAETKPDDAKPAETKPAETKPEEAKAEAPATEQPAVKSSFLAEKPATEEKAPEKPAVTEAKAEATKPAETKPAEAKPAETKAEAPATEQPAAVKSSFIGTATDKKDDAPNPKGPSMPRNETFEDFLDRRIQQAKNPQVEAALRTFKADYKAGNLKLDDFDRQFIKERLSGNKPLTATKVNTVLDYAANKPENKGVVLPRVDATSKPQATAPKAQTTAPRQKGNNLG